MKQFKYPQVRVISLSDPHDFENQVNSHCAELRNKSPELEINTNGEKLVAVIRYFDCEEVCESVSDEFHAEGIRFICRQCPYHETVTDGRRKLASCPYSDLGQIHLEHEACEYFYKQVKTGKVEPLEILKG